MHSHPSTTDTATLSGQIWSTAGGKATVSVTATEGHEEIWCADPRVLVKAVFTAYELVDRRPVWQFCGDRQGKGTMERCVGRPMKIRWTVVWARESSVRIVTCVCGENSESAYRWLFGASGYGRQ